MRPSISTLVPVAALSTSFLQFCNPAILQFSSVAIAQEAAPANLPYAAVHNPEFIPVAAATFMNPEDRVIGVMDGTVAKAFPAGILAQHGLVEDKSPSGPIAVTW
jgi:hypothetical protein